MRDLLAVLFPLPDSPLDISLLTGVADELDRRAASTGLAAPVLVADTLREIVETLRDAPPNEVPIGAIEALLRAHVELIQKGDPLDATAHAFELRKLTRAQLRQP